MYRRQIINAFDLAYVKLAGWLTPKFTLNKQDKQTLLVVLGIVVAFNLLIMMSWDLVVNANNPKSDKGTLVKIPLSLYEASYACEQKMAENLGERLLRAYLDEHSSREESTLFRIYYKADVGSLKFYDEVMVYCYIDRFDYQLTYYREVDPTAKQRRFTDLKFFNLKN